MRRRQLLESPANTQGDALDTIFYKLSVHEWAYVCLSTGTMDFFVTVQLGDLRFISCGLNTTISTNTLPPSPERRGTRDELQSGGLS